VNNARRVTTVTLKVKALIPLTAVHERTAG
jgi:hypothetical protein